CGVTDGAADRRRTEGVLAAAGLRYAVRDGLVKVSVVGAGMHGVPGVMARVMRALDAAGTELLATADSHASIACLVPAEDVPRVVQALHDEFGLGVAEGQREATVHEAG